MKKVLITGANSYIGCHVENWLKSRDGEYEVHTADLKNKDWQKQSFAGYDTVFHVAGIAHVSADPKLKDVYFAVNRDLTIAAAKKAKEDGAKQFIFMSSIIVYGNSARVGKERWITASTRETPADFYGQSKLEAEQGICPLADEYEPGEPECGFLFPAYTDGGADLNHVAVFQKDADRPHLELVRSILRVK